MVEAEQTRRDEILATAASLFASSGYRVSVQEIAAASGIVPAGLYHHFESKDAIVVELVRRYRDDLVRIAEQADRSVTPPLTRCRSTGSSTRVVP